MIIFHELTHQKVYVADDSAFNEALATFVEEEGVRRWLTKQGRDTDLAGFSLQQARAQQVLDLMSDTRGKLRTLYASALAPPQMREAKRAAFADMRAAYARLKAGWGGTAPYQGWFAEDLNNAHLVSVATYRRCVPGFARELVKAGGNMPAFFAAVRGLARLTARGAMRRSAVRRWPVRG